MEWAAHHSKKTEETHTSTSNHHDSLNKLSYQKKNWSNPPPSRTNRQSPPKLITVCGRFDAKGHSGAECRPSKGKTFCFNVQNKKDNTSTKLKKKTHTSNQLATTVLPLKFSSDEET